MLLNEKKCLLGRFVRVHVGYVSLMGKTHHCEGVGLRMHQTKVDMHVAFRSCWVDTRQG